MVTTLLGTFNPCKTEVEATASGGEMIPPKRKPNAKEKSGMMALDTMATPAEVKITSPKDNRPIGRRIFQKSFQEVFHAAAYKRGGKKIRKTRSGCNVTEGMPGIRLIPRPLITNKIG